MSILPPDHAERYSLAMEVHARPPEPLETPSRASHVAVLVAADQRDAERAHLAELCQRFGVAPPEAGRTHFSAQLDALRFKWERHGEFSGYTFFASGLGPRRFADTPAEMLPQGWLAQVPGRTIVAAHAELLERPPGATLDTTAHADAFNGNIIVGAAVGDGVGTALTDFRVHADGFARFLVFDGGFTQRQAGRMLQRLFEIEVYRMMSLLALPIARQQGPRALAIETELSVLTQAIAREGGDDEALLHQLSRLAAEVESALAGSQFRYGATRAYHALVTTRIGELRELRLPGIQTLEEFMARRLSPAVATCTTVAQRLHDLSERVAQASALLSTRVSIARERQNQTLLQATARRAQLQLRLQQTVEGLSVAAIVYYLAGLVGYGAKGLKAAGVKIDPDLVVAVAIPLLLGSAVWVLRRAHQRLKSGERQIEADPL